MRLLLVLVLESTMMVDLSTSSPLMPTALSSPNEFEGCTERVAESPARFSYGAARSRSLVVTIPLRSS